MPSANGVYSLPVGYLAVTGQTILASQHNPPLEDIAAALTGRLSRDGTAPMLGPVQAAAGTAAAPSLTFAADNSTGFFKTTNGLGVSVGGVQVAELAGGVRFLGELIPYTGSTAQPLTAFPFGQTLSRTTYAGLWALAQVEIAAGNTWYNNGNGSTTFGIGDVRGRVPAGWDAMGGTASGRLTTAGGGVDGTKIGPVGGAQSSTLVTGNLPAYTPSGTITNGVISMSPFANSTATGNRNSIPTGPSGTQVDLTSILGISQATSTFSGNAQGGSSTAFTNNQPTIVCSYLLYAGA